MKLIKSIFFVLVLCSVLFVWGILRYPLETARLLPFLPSIQTLSLSTDTPKTVEKGDAELLVPKESYVKLEEIPLSLRQAVVAIEDQRFYQHNGVDLYGIGRALFNDVVKQNMGEGASTITQQLARNLFLNQNQTVERKLSEIILALQLEEYYPNKDKLLELYINNVYYGRNAWGIRNAVRVYLPKTEVSALSVSESAFLASLPQSPSFFATNTEAALNRQRTVVEKMKELGYLQPSFVNIPPEVKN
ncbi:MAG TPA: biosynthetic peptidoglycan transglycosylase [Candidatus Deferrimicrobium sp.]|nr:biosynthetic peptidoglycan transglycosylase [Candidatus Deferrimicrobium sp.]